MRVRAVARLWMLGVASFLRFHAACGTERTRAIHQQILAQRGDHHVGPPHRSDARIKGSLNASTPSDTPTARQLRRQCTVGAAAAGTEASRPPREDEARHLLARIARHGNPDRGSLPSLRRKIARLVMCWGVGVGDESVVARSETLRDLVRTYFDFYTDAMRFRTAIYFVHVSKAGGTSFCAVSYENGCRDPNYHNGTSVNSWRWNCWSREHGDGPLWTIVDKGRPGWRKDPRNGWWAIDARKKTSPLYNSCLALEQEVMSKGTTFLMNENWLPGGSSALPQNRRRRLTASPASAHATTLPSAPSSADAAATHRLRHARLRRQRSVAGSFDGLSAFAKTQVAAPALPLTPSLRSSMASAMPPPPVTLCSQFMNVILVREPTARIVSHRNYMHALGAAGGKTPMPLGTMSEFVEVAPIVTNNFYIRILNGEEVYRLPRFNITRNHLDNAAKVLSSFDIVMTLETMTLQSPIVIRRGFGWEKNKILSLNNRRDNQKPLPVTGAEMALLREHNQLDLALYKRAQELSEFDFEYFRLVQLLIEKGQLQLPTTETASDLPTNVVPPEHRWKLRPQSAKDPGVKCLRSCGYICHVDFPEETSK